MSYTDIIADGTVLGDIPGILPGTFFRDRQELHDKKLHRGLMRGIASHGSSIVLSGGYVDDEDLGDVIIYTGEGGRDPITGQQIADQQLLSGNKALAENHLNGIPIMTVSTALRATGRNLGVTVSKFGGFGSRGD